MSATRRAWFRWMLKAADNAAASLRNLVGKDKYPDIRYGMKLCDRNVGLNGSFYTFPIPAPSCSAAT